MDPSVLYLIENTHLHPIVFFPLGSGINLHVLFFYKASISSCMACAHLGSTKASSTFFGIWQENNVFVKAWIGFDKCWVDT